MSDDPYPRLPYDPPDTRELCEFGHWITFLEAKLGCTAQGGNPDQCIADAYAAYIEARNDCPAT